MPPHSPADDKPLRPSGTSDVSGSTEPRTDVPPLPLDTPRPDRRFQPVHLVLNAIRGALIGLAELVPGISGGTVALITGVFERLIDGASHVVSAFKRLVFGPERARGFASEMRRVDWWLVVPVVSGMIAILLTLAGPIEHLVSSNVEASRGLFFGLVAVSIIVPLRLLPKGPHSTGAVIGGVVLFVVAAAVAFLLIALTGSEVDAEPPLWFVGIAAAIAVCALVVPGVSGSFFLLAVGLYSPTLRAVDERHLAYLGVFALGALVGLVTIVRVVKWLLDRYRRLTLLAMSGLMLGSLRALWPWQDTPEDSHGVGALLLPTEPLALPILLALAGATAVIVLLVVEHHLHRRTSAATQVPSLDIE